MDESAVSGLPGRAPRVAGCGGLTAARADCAHAFPSMLTASLDPAGARQNSSDRGKTQTATTTQQWRQATEAQARVFLVEQTQLCRVSVTRKEAGSYGSCYDCPLE